MYKKALVTNLSRMYLIHLPLTIICHQSYNQIHITSRNYIGRSTFRRYLPYQIFMKKYFIYKFMNISIVSFLNTYAGFENVIVPNTACYIC